MTPTLKQIEDTARAATQGEWQLLPRAAATVCYERRNIANCAGYSDNMDRDKSDAENDANAAHIAMMSPQRTLELVADLRAAAEALENSLAAYTRCPQAVHDTGRLEEWRKALQNLKRWGL